MVPDEVWVAAESLSSNIDPKLIVSRLWGVACHEKNIAIQRNWRYPLTDV
jgi:hypothetical protein